MDTVGRNKNIILGLGVIASLIIIAILSLMCFNDSRRDSKLDSIIQAIEKIRETKLDLITKTIEKTSSKRDEKLDSMTQTIEKISSVMMNETLTFGPY